MKKTYIKPTIKQVYRKTGIKEDKISLDITQPQLIRENDITSKKVDGPESNKYFAFHTEIKKKKRVNTMTD